MPLYLVRVRAVEVREYFVEVESEVAACEELSEPGDRGEPDKTYWDTEEMDDPLECCPDCRMAYADTRGLPCCSIGWLKRKKNETK